MDEQSKIEFIDVFKKRTKIFALRTIRLYQALPKTLFGIEILIESEIVKEEKLNAMKIEITEILSVLAKARKNTVGNQHSLILSFTHSKFTQLK